MEVSPCHGSAGERVPLLFVNFADGHRGSFPNRRINQKIDPAATRGRRRRASEHGLPEVAEDGEGIFVTQIMLDAQEAVELGGSLAAAVGVAIERLPRFDTVSDPHAD